jgi:hypothetical protein
VREFVVFKASENVVEGSKVLDVVILPWFREPIQPSENGIPNIFDNAARKE